MPANSPNVTIPLSLILAALPLASTALAHGGQYRGPGSITPPASGTGASANGSRASGGAASAGSGAPAGPSTGAPASTAVAPARGAGAAAPRGIVLEDDPTRWEFWWEFGKDPYLRLREAVYGANAQQSIDDLLLNRQLAQRRRNVEPPNRGDLDRVPEALVAALHHANDRDTVSSCLIALAKIGRDGKTWQLHDEFLPFLASGDQELRETAALAYGIAGIASDADLALLRDLVLDLPAGRKVSGGAAVNERTRAFAAFGLGLLLQRGRDLGKAHRIVETCIAVLDNPQTTSRDLRVAAIEALSLLPRDWEGVAAQSLRDGAVRALSAYFDQDLGPGEQLVQAHVPTSLQRLVRPGEPRAAALRDQFVLHLERELDVARKPPPEHKVNAHVAQSCAMALGELVPSWDAAGDQGEAVARLLLRTYRDHRDMQTRSFALLSVGRIGGRLAQAALLDEFTHAGRAIEQPWCAVALGVLVARKIAADRDAEVDQTVAKTLRRAFDEAHNPASRGALAISLGLCQDLGAADAMRATLIEESQRDDLAGYLALGLGIMRDPRATAEVRGLLAASTRRPQVMLQATRALGLLGDGAVVGDLCEQLEKSEPSLARLSAIALALGQIGDRSSLAVLLRMLDDARLTPLTRAFAAVALGGVCDKDPLPWNAVYATNTNYRAATATLTDGSAGILDIL